MSRRASQRSMRSVRMEIDDENEAGPSNAPPRVRPSKQSFQRHATFIADDSEEEEQATQSSRRLTQLAEEDEDHVLGSLLRYLLSASATKQAIKHTDIKANAIPKYQKRYASLMTKVKIILHEDFGYNLINIGSQKWMIVNALPPDQIHIKCSPSEIAEQTLLFIVLTHIFMSGGICREEPLFRFLKTMMILQEDVEAHPYLGPIQELVSKKFVAQLYLVRTKIPDNDNEIYNYSWGPRATEELDARSVLEFVCKVYRGRPLESFRQQYIAALREPNNNFPG